MFLDTLRSEVSQGDIFRNCRVADIVPGANVDRINVTLRTTDCMLLSNDCDYDNKKFVLVGEIAPITRIRLEHRDALRNGQARRLFYLPELPGQLPEGFVQFTDMHRIDKGLLTASGGRIVSLSDDGRLALQRRIAIFFSAAERP
jgi:hypothetical protein